MFQHFQEIISLSFSARHAQWNLPIYVLYSMKLPNVQPNGIAELLGCRIIYVLHFNCFLNVFIYCT